MNPNYFVTTQATSSSPSPTGLIIALIVGIVGAFLVYFLFLDPKKEDSYSGFVKKLYDFLSFKTMTLEFFLKILYLFTAIFITVYSLSLLSVRDGLLLFLLFFVIGNVTARLVYEGSILFLMMYKRVNEISEALKPKKNEKKVEKKEEE